MKTNTLLSLFLCFLLASCAPATPAATPTPCPYMRVPGNPPPEVEKRAKDAFYALSARGIRGAIKVEADGEQSCDHFAVAFVNFEYTLYVNDLTDKKLIEEFVSTVRQSAGESAQGWNLGSVRVRFISGEECRWDDQQNACTPIIPLTHP